MKAFITEMRAIISTIIAIIPAIIAIMKPLSVPKTAENGQNQGLTRNLSENPENGWQMGGATHGVGKSGGGPSHSKTWRIFRAAPANAKRLGVRQPSGALERDNGQS
jgi:hypothetical protein